MPIQNSIRRRTGLSGALVLGLALWGGHSALGQVEIKLSHTQPATHSWGVAMDGFAADVNKETQGRVHITVYPSGQLGNETTAIQGLQIGSIQMSLPDSGAFQSLEPRLGIIQLPYAWPTPQHAYRALDGELGDALAKLLAAKNIVVLGWLETGVRHVTNNRGPVRAPDDLKGLKIRVPPDKIRLDTFKILGAEPGPLSWGEVYSALQMKVFDAQENPLAIIHGGSLFEVQKYLSLTGHLWGATVLVAAKPTWDRISAGDQAIMRTAAAKWRDVQRWMSRESDNTLIATLKEKGMVVNEVDKAIFMKAVEPVWKQYESVFGADLMALVRKYGQT